MSTSEVAIRTTGLSKVYSRTDVATKQGVPFYALKDINLEVAKGEVLGVIGNNGSGKSTLLRVLSGITKPSEGSVEINGTIASILDIGTGFHPDLSGRENAYMRGRLIGMQKSEIDAVFDELVAFSGVADFIDSPVKHYSSGMFLRLAFSTIIHLNSDILLLDEILAVGDYEFRQKCAQKITEIVTSGKTVIMVSHDLQNVLDLCTLTALMKDGEIVKVDTPMRVISDSYLSKISGFEDSEMEIVKNRILSEKLKPTSGEGYELISIKALQGAENPVEEEGFKVGQEVAIEMEYMADREGLNFGIVITDFLMNRLIDDSPMLHKWDFTKDFVGRFKANWSIPKKLLNPGRYYVTVYVFDNDMKVLKRYSRALEFKIQHENGKFTQNPIYYSPINVDLGLRFEQVSDSK